MRERWGAVTSYNNTAVKEYSIRPSKLLELRLIAASKMNKRVL